VTNSVSASVDILGAFVVCCILLSRSVEGHAIETRDGRSVDGSM